MNRWYFWLLAPVMMAGAVIIPMVAEPPSPMGGILAYAIAATLLLATLGLADANRFRWALRGVAALVLAVGVAYFASEFVAWRNGKPMGVLGRRSNSSLWNAGLFLFVVGIPALRYLIHGRSGAAVDVIAADVLDDGDPDGALESDESDDDVVTTDERVTDEPLEPR